MPLPKKHIKIWQFLVFLSLFIFNTANADYLVKMSRNGNGLREVIISNNTCYALKVNINNFYGAIGSSWRVKKCLRNNEEVDILEVNDVVQWAYYDLYRITNYQVDELEKIERNYQSEFDFTLAGKYFAFSLTSILSFWLLGLGIGFILKVVKEA